ncbi:MAG: NAD(P)/FAD-dependent oxidoreductase [Geminicoccaceae bacterium]|nr:NAD(P)/FAD-dependent oxidoreductase [Geminicoccaceae bacterium]
MTDVLVLGGGPAGVVAAVGLARAGVAVRLATVARPAAVEGLSERVLQALGTSGCRHGLAAVGPAVRRGVIWNGSCTAPNVEWMVERAAFDRALLRDAEEAGVVLHAGRALKPDRRGARWSVVVGGKRVDAGFLIDARGRRAPGAVLRGPATTALARRWTGLSPRPRSAIASFPRGFAWFATAGDGTGVLQLFVANAGLPPRAELEAFYRAAVEEIAVAADWLGSARPEGLLGARPAAISRSSDPIGPTVLRIGDAALALDPLAGHGVFEAIASGLAAVPVVKTILERPHQRALAEAFVRQRLDHAFERFARVGRDFYRLEQQYADRPFWRERAAWPDDLPAHARPDGSTPRVAKRPVVEDGYVVERDVMVTADEPRGVFQVAGVALAPLYEALRGGAEADELVRRFARPHDAIGTATAWLRWRGMID